MSSKILVTGGCGYIGSHVTRQLSESGYDVVVFDNLSTGFPDALIHNETLVKGDLADEALLDKLFDQHKFSSVLHFAASVVVPESVSNPIKYYQNNTDNTLKLLKRCVDHKVNKFVFSSTAAVYGDRYKDPVKEEFDPAPESPYARSKLMDEWILKDISDAHGLNYVILRYFNVAGADPELRMGQRTPNASHLIKIACEKACGKRDEFFITGDDWDTPDGTGIRDYIHIEDLASAHLEALKYLEAGGVSDIFNCGYGNGYSVKEVVEKFESVNGVSLNAAIAPRRPGDIAQIIASVDKIKSKLPSWQPKFNDLSTIVSSAYQWEKKTTSSFQRSKMVYE